MLNFGSRPSKAQSSRGQGSKAKGRSGSGLSSQSKRAQQALSQIQALSQERPQQALSHAQALSQAQSQKPPPPPAPPAPLLRGDQGRNAPMPDRPWSSWIWNEQVQFFYRARLDSDNTWQYEYAASPPPPSSPGSLSSNPLNAPAQNGPAQEHLGPSGMTAMAGALDPYMNPSKNGQVNSPVVKSPNSQPPGAPAGSRYPGDDQLSSFGYGDRGPGGGSYAPAGLRYPQQDPQLFPNHGGNGFDPSQSSTGQYPQDDQQYNNPHYGNNPFPSSQPPMGLRFAQADQPPGPKYGSSSYNPLKALMGQPSQQDQQPTFSYGGNDHPYHRTKSPRYAQDDQASLISSSTTASKNPYAAYRRRPSSSVGGTSVVKLKEEVYRKTGRGSGPKALETIVVEEDTGNMQVLTYWKCRDGEGDGGAGIPGRGSSRRGRERQSKKGRNWDDVIAVSEAAEREGRGRRGGLKGEKMGNTSVFVLV